MKNTGEHMVVFTGGQSLNGRSGLWPRNSFPRSAPFYRLAQTGKSMRWLYRCFWRAVTLSKRIQVRISPTPNGIVPKGTRNVKGRSLHRATASPVGVGLDQRTSQVCFGGHTRPLPRTQRHLVAEDCSLVEA